MKSFKKLFAIVATAAMLSTLVPTVSFAAGFSDELQGAYDYAYGMGVTTQSSIDSANMYGSLIRSHMAKMMVEYAKEVKGLTADTSVEVNFSDIADQSTELQGYIKEAAQMGLMGLNSDGSVASKFNPNGVVTRAQFGTVLDRVLNGDANNGSEPYYAAHLSALKAAGVMTKIDTPDATEVRGYVMLMMQRADEGTSGTPATCSTAENILACTLGTSACPAECQETPVVENAEGNLSVKLASSEGADVPYGVPALEVATYKFTADEDVRIDSVTFERAGYVEDTSVPTAALYVNGARVSKVASFNSDDEATVNLTNGYTVKAGETVEFAVKVAVANLAGAAGDQFSIKLASVSSTAKDVNLASGLTSDTFKILSKANKFVTYTVATVEDPKLGEEDADLFDFSLNNTGSDQDATLNSITFKKGTGTVDYSSDLKNFSLVVDGETIATTDKMNGNYLTFVVEDGYLIKDTKKANFTVKADVVGGASDTVNFYVEKASDVNVDGNTYNVPLNVANAEGTLSAFATVSAGKVAIEKVNTEAGDLIGNKDNIFLGAFTITNNADQSLSLKKLSFSFAGNTGVLENVKVKLGSTTASPIDLDMSASNTTWSDSDLDKAVGSKLTVYVYADTIDTGMDGKSLRMTLSKLLIEETQNDETVSDITPSTLTWSTMAGSSSNVTLTNVALGDKTVSEGTEGIDSVQFKIKAGAVYATKVKQMTFTAKTSTGLNVDSDTITAATLVNGSDEIPATVKNGTIVVDEDFTIKAGSTSTLTLKLDLASNPEAITVKTAIAGSDIEAVEVSADADDVTIGGSVTGRLITIVSAGEIQATYESSADNNKYNKNILAGDSKVVAEYSLYSKYEAVNVGSGIVTFSNDMSGSALDVVLYYGDTEVASNPTWNANGTKAVFDDLDFDTSTAKKALTVKVISKVIDDNGGATLAATSVTNITLGDLKGKDSGDDLANASITGTSKTFNIVPVTIVPAVTALGSTKGDFTVTATNGTNTTTGGDEAKATLTGIVFTVDGNNGALTKLTVKDDAGTVLGSGNVTGDGDVTVVLSKVLSNGGSTTLSTTTTVSGSINTPSYNVSLKSLIYGTNVAAGTLNVEFGAAKTLITK